MGDNSLKELDWLEVIKVRGLPRHVVQLKFSEEKHRGFLLSSIDEINQRKRNTLILPRSCYESLSPDIRWQIKQFTDLIFKYTRKYNLKTAPALNKIVSEHKKTGILAPFKVATIAYRPGVVPALIIGKHKEWQCAVIPTISEHFSEEPNYSEEECLEILTSLDIYFRHLCRAYYEQIAYYSNAIFFGADDDEILSYCFKIRHLLDISLGKKLEILNNPIGPKAKILAKSIREKYGHELVVAQSVQRIGDQIVKYIYASYGVNYSINSNERRQKLPSLGDVDEGADILNDILKHCEENFASSNDTLTRELNRKKASIPDWAFLIGQVSRFVGEIRRATHYKDKLLPVPRVFLGHHFTVKDSAFFHAAFCLKYGDEVVRIIRGRQLGIDISWSMLALIWLSDHQILFIPDSLEESDGQFRKLGKSEDWVIKELLYGRYIYARFTIIVSERQPAIESRPVRSQLRNQIKAYTDECELKQIAALDDEQQSKISWKQFIKEAKADLIDQLTDKRYIPFTSAIASVAADSRNRKLLGDAQKQIIHHTIEANGHIDLMKMIGELERKFGKAESGIIQSLDKMTSDFEAAIDSGVYHKATVVFVNNIFLAWSKIFFPGAWSVARLLIKQCGADGHGSIMIKELVNLLKQNGKMGKRGYLWINSSNGGIEKRVLKYINQIDGQQLLFNGAPVPLTATIIKTPDGLKIDFSNHSNLIIDRFVEKLPKKTAVKVRLDVKTLLNNDNVKGLNE